MDNGERPLWATVQGQKIRRTTGTAGRTVGSYGRHGGHRGERVGGLCGQGAGTAAEDKEEQRGRKDGGRYVVFVPFLNHAAQCLLSLTDSNLFLQEREQE